MQEEEARREDEEKIKKNKERERVNRLLYTRDGLTLALALALAFEEESTRVL